MKIETLKIQNYKKIKNLELKFDPGINIIVGDNEAGKSTVSQAFLDLLFVDPATKAQSFISRVKPWGSTALPKLEMVFHALGSQYLLSKNFDKKTLVLENLDTKRKVDTYKESLGNIKKIIGINNEQIYRKTAFISQGDVALVDSSDDLLHEITNESENSQAQSGAQTIIKKLQAELNTLNKGLDRPSNTPGPIKSQQEKIANLTKFLEERQKLWEKKQTASSKQESSGGELEQLNNKITQIEELLKNHKLAKQGKSDLDEISQQLKAIEEKLLGYEQLESQAKTLEEKLQKYKKYDSSNLEEGVKQIAGLEQTLKHLDKELKRVANTENLTEQKIETEVKTAPLSSKNSVPWKILLYVLIMAGSVLVSLLTYLQTRELLILGIVASLGLLIVCSLVIWGKINSRDSNVVITTAEQQPLQKIKTDLETTVAKNKADLDKILAEFGVSSAADFYSLKADYLSVQTEYSDVKSRQNVLLGDKTLEQLKETQVNLLVKKKEIETTILTDIVKNSEIKPEKYLEKSRELDKLIIQKRKLEEDLIISKTRVGDTDVEYAEIVALEEELALAKSQLSTLIKKQKVLSLAIETMKEAVLEVAKSANKILAQTIDTNLPRLTNNHYAKVRVNPDLTIQVYAQEKNDWVDPIAELSRGTIDQIYFLVRLGFLKLITENKTVPLILDDPFVTADPVRREKFREILEEYASQYQVFLFTNDYDYADWGNVIQLS